MLKYEIKYNLSSIYWGLMGQPSVSGVYGEDSFRIDVPISYFSSPHIVNNYSICHITGSSSYSFTKTRPIYDENSSAIGNDGRASLCRLSDNYFVFGDESNEARIVKRGLTSSFTFSGTTTSHGFNFVNYRDHYFAVYGGTAWDDFKLGMWTESDMAVLGEDIRAMADDSEVDPGATLRSSLVELGTINTGIGVSSDMERWHLSDFQKYETAVGPTVHMILYEPSIGLAAYQLSTSETVTVVDAITEQQQPQLQISGRTVSFTSPVNDLTVYDCTGRTVLERHATAGLSSADLTAFTPGFYIIRFATSSTSTTAKIVLR